MKTLVIEAMGFDSADYEAAKMVTHPRMERLGQLVTIDPSEVEQDIVARKIVRTLDL